jgi:REP element-mobilizing transposase RayT
MRKIPLTLFNPKGAGRPKGRSKHYIPHLKREKIPKQTPVHVTIKINKEYKGLRSKAFLNMLKHAIKKARLKGLAVIHFTVQIDHIHLFLEPKNNQKLTQGMRSLICSLAERVRRSRGLKKLNQFVKERYHLHILRTLREVKNAVRYILGNTIKHTGILKVLCPYTFSYKCAADFSLDPPRFWLSLNY